MALDNFDIGAAATGALDTASSAVWPILWSVVGIVTVIFLWWYLSHRHEVRIRLMTHSRSFPIKDKAREVMVDGVPYWKLLKRKDIIPVPPAEAMDHIGRDILGKPKFYCEFYYSVETGYHPIKDSMTTEKLKASSKNPALDGSVNDTFQPFTPSQRALFVTQLRKAEARRKQSTLDKVMQMATPIAFIFLIVMILFFWEDIAQPAKDMASSAAGMQELNKQLLAQNAEISNQNARMLQVIAGKLEADQLVLQQNLPAEGEA